MGTIILVPIPVNPLGHAEAKFSDIVRDAAFAGPPRFRKN